MFKRILSAITQFIFPNVCIGCQSTALEAKQILCVSCHKYLPFTHNYYAGNPTEKIFLGRIALLGASSLLYFQKNGIAQNLIHALKYKNNKAIAALLGALMAKHLQKAKWPLQNTILVPVPLTAKRLQQRGYNQSLLIAEAIANELQLSISSDIVYRTRNTETQTKKTRLERLQNMEGAFELANASNFENKHVILIDDVITSGATLEACALAFKKVENINISILCAAISSEN
jgi:ComF family protein